MARSGSFSAPNFALGVPIGVVKPRDNRVPLYDAALSALHANQATTQDLQSEVDELAAAMTLARDYES